LPTGPEDLVPGAAFRLDLTMRRGRDPCATAAPRDLCALEPGATLLVNDGKIRLKVTGCGPDFANCTVIVGGTISNRKGVNVPDVVLPLARCRKRTASDLEFVCDLGVDWLALSFVQRPEDVTEARELARGRAAILSKIEKPAAVKAFDAILAVSDGIMVARGDLGVECPVQNVPPIQKRLVRVPCRGQAGDRGHADAGIDDRKPDADARRGVGRGDRDL
jgi:pyruvate kinase